MQKENRLIQCVCKQWKSTKRWRVLIHKMIKKQQVKNEEKKNLCLEVFKFQDNKFKIV